MYLHCAIYMPKAITHTFSHWVFTPQLSNLSCAPILIGSPGETGPQGPPGYPGDDGTKLLKVHSVFINAYNNNVLNMQVVL